MPRFCSLLSSPTYHVNTNVRMASPAAHHCASSISQQCGILLFTLIPSVFRSSMAHGRAPDTHDQTLRATRMRKVSETAFAALATAAVLESTKQISAKCDCDSQISQPAQSSCNTTGYHVSWTKETSGVDNHVCPGIGETRLWSTLSNCLSRLDAGCSPAFLWAFH